MRFETASSFNALIMNGKWTHVVRPWRIIIDTDEETVTVRKRNADIFGVDEQIIAFRFIRNIYIDQHVFGADIHIKPISGKISACYIPKKAAKTIKKILIKYNQTKKGRSIIFS